LSGRRGSGSFASCKQQQVAMLPQWLLGLLLGFSLRFAANIMLQLLR